MRFFPMSASSMFLISQFTCAVVVDILLLWRSARSSIDRLESFPGYDIGLVSGHDFSRADKFFDFSRSGRASAREESALSSLCKIRHSEDEKTAGTRSVLAHLTSSPRAPLAHVSSPHRWPTCEPCRSSPR